MAWSCLQNPASLFEWRSDPSRRLRGSQCEVVLQDLESSSCSSWLWPCSVFQTVGCRCCHEFAALVAKFVHFERRRRRCRFHRRFISDPPWQASAWKNDWRPWSAAAVDLLLDCLMSDTERTILRSFYLVYCCAGFENVVGSWPTITWHQSICFANGLQLQHFRFGLFLIKWYCRGNFMMDYHFRAGSYCPRRWGFWRCSRIVGSTGTGFALTGSTILGLSFFRSASSFDSSLAVLTVVWIRNICQKGCDLVAWAAGSDFFWKVLLKLMDFCSYLIKLYF